MPQSALRHVDVDHRCTLDEMAKLLVDLANDAPTEPAPRAAEALLETENRIAEGVFNLGDWWRVEQMSKPSGLNCPECRSALYELREERILRFRCRSGHAFSALSLVSGQADAREAQLSSIFGGMIEDHAGETLAGHAWLCWRSADRRWSGGARRRPGTRERSGLRLASHIDRLGGAGADMTSLQPSPLLMVLV